MMKETSDLTSKEIDEALLSKWKEFSNNEIAIIKASLQDYYHEDEYLMSLVKLQLDEVDHVWKLRPSDVQQNPNEVKQE